MLYSGYSIIKGAAAWLKGTLSRAIALK